MGLFIRAALSSISSRNCLLGERDRALASEQLQKTMGQRLPQHAPGTGAEEYATPLKAF